MMEIYDFAAFLQVIIAFYGVYTLSYKMAEKTFLFNIIRLKIKKNSKLFWKRLPAFPIQAFLRCSSLACR